jgi:hypothetical protein
MRQKLDVSLASRERRFDHIDPPFALLLDEPPDLLNGFRTKGRISNNTAPPNFAGR